MDRFVGRMLDTHAKQHRATAQPLNGLVNGNLYKKGQEYCRVNYYASTIRRAINTFINLNIHCHKWKDVSVWKQVLPTHNKVIPSLCAMIDPIT